MLPLSLFSFLLMKVYTDASRGEEIIGLGWNIVHDGVSIEQNRYMTGTYTSMQAEYFALLDGLRYARREQTGNVTVICDCEPLVQKMRVPDSDKDWYDRRQGCHRLLNKFDSWELKWKSRKYNDVADRLAYEALQKGRSQ